MSSAASVALLRFSSEVLFCHPRFDLASQDGGEHHHRDRSGDREHGEKREPPLS